MATKSKARAQPQAQPAAAPAADHSEAPAPEFSRQMALFWLTGIDEKLNRIRNVAFGGQAVEERQENGKDTSAYALFEVIYYEAEEAACSNALRDMLEALPVGAPHE